MLRALKSQGLLPRSWSRLPADSVDPRPLLEYAGPLLVVVACRFMGLACMAFAAAALGTISLAAYQVLINLLVLFGLVGEPLSQAAQAALPPLLERGKSRAARRAFKELLRMGLLAAAVAGGLAGAMAYFGGGLFSSEPAVLAQVRTCAGPLALTVAALVISYPIDGGMLATRDFRVLVALSAAVVVLQLPFLAAVVDGWGRGVHGMAGTALALVLVTYAFRFMAYAVCALGRVMRRGGVLDPMGSKGYTTARAT